MKEFEIKELGLLKYFLGIKVARSQQGIFVSQQQYILDLLKEIRKLACKPANMPIETNHKLGDNNNDASVDQETIKDQWVN